MRVKQLPKILAVTLVLAVVGLGCGETAQPLQLVPNLRDVVLPESFTNQSELPQEGELYLLQMDDAAWQRTDGLATRLEVLQTSVEQPWAAWANTQGASLLVNQVNGQWNYQLATIPTCVERSCAIEAEQGLDVVNSLVKEDLTYQSSVQAGARVYRAEDSYGRVWEVAVGADGKVLSARGNVASLVSQGNEKIVDQGEYEERLQNIYWHVKAAYAAPKQMAGLKSHESAHVDSQELFPYRIIEKTSVGHAVLQTPQGQMYAVPIIEGYDDYGTVWSVVGMKNAEMLIDGNSL